MLSCVSVHKQWISQLYQIYFWLIDVICCLFNDWYFTELNLFARLVLPFPSYLSLLSFFYLLSFIFYLFLLTPFLFIFYLYLFTLFVYLLAMCTDWIDKHIQCVYRWCDVICLLMCFFICICICIRRARVPDRRHDFTGSLKIMSRKNI